MILDRIRQMLGSAEVAARDTLSALGGRSIRARYDAAQTTAENQRHWAAADHLSADAAASPDIRARLRSRARYETANNSYARGIVDTLAAYVVGIGPRLQMLTDDDQANRAVETAFSAWARSIDLPEKLRAIRAAQAESGEVFGLLATNPNIPGPVQLDLRLIEADQVTTPFTGSTPYSGSTTSGGVDGIELDAQGHPIAYHVMRDHPGDRTWAGAAGKYDTVPAGLMIHVFRALRPGQSRGVPDLTPALPLFAMLRRYTLAVLGAAEQAALPGGVIYTDAPAEGESPEVEPMDQVNLDRGTWLTMPHGWKIGQIDAQQPTTQYGDFKSQIINEIARALNMPFNLAAGNSSSYNYASGRLDHQAFFKSIKIDQQRLAQAVLDRLLHAWLSEAVLVEGLLPQSLRTLDAPGSGGGGIPHQWFFDGAEHVDPVKEASAQKIRLASGTTTLASEYGRAGLDWEQELRQQAREQQLRKELGLLPAEVTPPKKPAPAPTPGSAQKDTAA